MVANAAGPSLDRYNAEAILVRPAHMMTDEMDAVTGCFRRDSSDRVAISNDPTVFKPDHAIGKTQDFGYVMAHEKGRSAEFVMQTFELILQLSPHCRIECGERFVEHENVGAARECPDQGKPLLLPS